MIETIGLKIIPFCDGYTWYVGSKEKGRVIWSKLKYASPRLAVMGFRKLSKTRSLRAISGKVGTDLEWVGLIGDKAKLKQRGRKRKRKLPEPQPSPHPQTCET